jgi:putative inorganic carbon (HCO3(-)) transporter
MRNTRIRPGVESTEEQGSRNAAFFLFCVFIVGYYVRITARIPLLGKLHFDLLVAAVTALAIAFAGRKAGLGSAPPLDSVTKRLLLLLGYIVVTIPFVEWPGSAVHNLETYVKSLCFFFFVVATVDTTRKLKVLLTVYAATQVWRVLEPLYMHVTSGYWGSFTSLGNWEYMDRLAGSPYDVINPNGLGFVIIMTLPILHFLVKPDTAMRRVVWAAVACAMCYALVLSASRSGFLAFVFLCLFFIWRSKHRAAWLTVAVLGATLAVSLMTDLQRERYLSIVSHHAKGSGTAEERINGVIGDFKVSLRRPFFGHGLGTSREANANFRGADMLSHDLYTEAAEELGYIGLGLLLALIWSFLRACRTAQQVVSAAPTTDERLRFLHSVAVSLVVVVAVDLFFSFAAYGLSEPYWYFLGALSVVTARLAVKLAPAAANGSPGQGQPQRIEPSAVRKSRTRWRGRALPPSAASGAGTP